MRQRNPQNRLVFGAILMIFGALALLDNLNIFNTFNIFHFWPMVFIAVGALKISRSDTVSGHLIGGMFIAVGAAMTLQHMGIIDFRMRNWWPIFLIAGGMAVIFKDRLITENNVNQLNPEQSPQNICNVSAMMSGAKINNASPDFQGGELTAVMGGIELDMRGASIQSEAILNVFAIWGGITVRVPNDWTVISQGVPLLGAIEDETVPPMEKSKKLYIQGYAIMGGVEIRN
ncbi:LiaI-LiaF-like domain-containing protein [Undibacterium curvum]|uniref:LiaI-LiaF-like domain-containing protein n=1 Tax=Undibacterium curvum TaxID=2762294 RepID=UPI003D10C64A